MTDEKTGLEDHFIAKNYQMEGGKFLDQMLNSDGAVAYLLGKKNIWVSKNDPKIYEDVREYEEDTCYVLYKFAFLINNKLVECYIFDDYGKFEV